MKRSGSLILGFFTLLSLVDFIFLIFYAVIYAGKNLAEYNWGELYYLINNFVLFFGLVLGLNAVLILVYSVLTLMNRGITAGMKFIWLAGIVFASLLFMPIYWYRYCFKNLSNKDASV